MTARTSDYSSLAAAISAAAGTGLVIDSPIEVTSNLSIAVPVEVEPGGLVRVADGMTLTFNGPFAAPPIRVFARETGWRGTVVFGDGGRLGPDGLTTEAVFVTPSWWENGAIDDTEAVQTALGYNRVRFTRDYRVISVTASRIYQNIDMGGFFLRGIATTAADAVLTLYNWREGRMFNAGITSDGDQATPAYALNYRCALRCRSEAPSTENTQYGYIHGLRIRNMKTGIVWGNHDGEAAQPSRPQSEFHIHGYSPVGVMVPFVGNALNAYLQFHDSIFVAQKGQAGEWWDNAEGRTLVNKAGLLRITGGSIQRAITAGYNLEGGSIVVENCDVERACTDYLTGDVTYRSCRNGHYGWPLTVPPVAPIPFKIAPGATGRLLLDDVVIRRDEGIASQSPHNLVDASEAPGYEIVFRDTVVKQWRVGANTASSYLVHGGQALFGDLTVDNSGSTAASYRLREGSNRLTTADPTGRAMSTVNDDLSPKGGWVSIGASSGGFYRITSDLPPDATEAIRLHATGTGVEIVTDKVFAVESGQSRIVDFWLKYTGATGSLRADLRWFDANPTPGFISQVVLLSQDQARLAANGFTNWLRFRAVGKAPDGAVAAKLSFYLGAGADLMITDIRVV